MITVTSGVINNKSWFEWAYKEDIGVLSIKDLNQGMSVTNNMENVLEDISLRIGWDIILKSGIIYRDSEGDWDEVRVSESKVVTFFPIGERTFDQALEIFLLNKSKKV